MLIACIPAGKSFVSIPQGTIKRLRPIEATHDVNMFQFHKVRLKAALLAFTIRIEYLFQFHKVRLKDFGRYMLQYNRAVSIPQGTIKS